MAERRPYRDILKQGVKAWNAWRVDNPDIRPWLSDEDLADVEQALGEGPDPGGSYRWPMLTGANFRGVVFEIVDLSQAHLNEADLRESILKYSNLFKADLSKADLRKANLFGTNLNEADLGNAILAGTYLRQASF